MMSDDTIIIGFAVGKIITENKVWERNMIGSKFVGTAGSEFMWIADN